MLQDILHSEIEVECHAVLFSLLHQDLCFFPIRADDADLEYFGQDVCNQC